MRKDIDRIVAIWESCRARYGKGGELLFGQFTIADAFYAPVATRFLTYAVALPRVAQRYADALLALPAVRDMDGAGAPRNRIRARRRALCLSLRLIR